MLSVDGAEAPEDIARFVRHAKPSTTAGYGPTEGLNALIKKVKHIAAGFRSFNHYRLRVLLHAAAANWALLGT
jgi:hypothetical protein